MTKYVVLQDFWLRGQTLIAKDAVIELKPVEAKWLSHVLTPYVETPAVEVKAEPAPAAAAEIVAVAKKVAKHKADEKADDAHG